MCITLSDIIQFLKHSKSGVLQKEVVTVMKILIDSVRGLTEYLEDSGSFILLFMNSNFLGVLRLYNR